MTELFFKGGPIFMGILTIILLIILIISVVFFINVSTRKINNSEQTLRKINTVKSLGIFALIIGILGQLIGLFSAFRAIRFGEVEASHELFAEGFKISMIPTAYGIFIFTFSIILWFLLKRVLKIYRKSSLK
ncbi:MotA/TolQ/ExbB proton channel family protein [Salegentibacter sp. UBA1130]|uniref:MotA/TolQ/ExbB proton channel family protein n=1 Tax=Salegentibacter sp. UBA1130 TaxID=1947451 RepID=UPI00257A55C3|nr:MotA/TolQ/ExbB proton channel family protein [Salegentibacter sp. UBA1130]